MKFSLTILLIAFCTFLSVHSFSAPVDTGWQGPAVSAASNSLQTDPIDDFSPGVAVAGLIGLLVVCIGIGVGIVLALILLLVLFGLVSVGIISASIINGLNKKSFATGFKTFFVLTSGTAGLFLTAGALVAANKLFHFHLTATVAALMGGICGLLAGMAVGIFSYYIFHLMFIRFKQKIGLF